MSLNLEERMALLPGVSARRIVHEMPWSARSELAVTPIARQRLRAWARAGCPIADPRDVPYFGDAATQEAVVSALGRIPSPIVHQVVTRCAVVGIGGAAWGCCRSVPADLGARFVVAVSGGHAREEVETIAAHEFAHAFLHSLTDEPRDLPTPERLAEREATARGLGNEWFGADGRQRLELEHVNRHEFQATSLVRCWGFTGSGAYNNKSNRRNMRP